MSDISKQTNPIKKTRVFFATDGPTVSTGFGRVAYELITRLLKTGRYEVISMATNDRGGYHPLRGMPGLVIEPLPYISEDPYGFQRMPELLKKYRPDLIFALNDVWVWTGDERRPQMHNWFLKHIKSYKPYVPFVGYFPVDGRPWTSIWKDMVNSMTFAVPYSDYGIKVLEETPGVDMSKVRRIYHGSSNDVFKPLSPTDAVEVKKMMGISEDTFLIGCVARNQPRKAIPRLIQAFKMFRDGYVKCANCGTPRNLQILKDCELCGATHYYEKVDGHQDSAMYLHMNVWDLRGFKLPKIIADNKADNVITRPDHNVADGVSVEELNRIYNAFDVHVLPTLAGGFELPVIEAQAAGTPNIATRTTAVTELMENESGYMVLPETQIILEDANHCYKHLISIQGLLDAFEMAYYDWKHDTERRKTIIKKGLKNARSKTWDMAAKQFDELFQEALSTKENLHEIIDTPNQQVPSLVFIHDTEDLSHLLSALPALKHIVKNNNGKVVLATKKSMMPLVNIDGLNVIDFDLMWIDDEGMKGKAVSIQSLGQVIPKMENGSIGYPEYSWSDAFCKVMNIERITDIPYSVTEDESKWAEKMLDYENEDKTFRTLSLVDISSVQTAVSPETWNQLHTFISRFDDAVCTVVSQPYLHEAMGGDIKLSSLTYREIFALVSKSDVVITSDERYVYLTNVFPNVKFVFIQGPRDNTFNIMGDNAVLVSEKIKYNCMPCWKNAGDKCRISGTQRPVCMETISSGEIFSKVLKIKKSMPEKKIKVTS